MEAGISVGGLVSGIDTNSIIDGLTNLEYSKVKRVEKQKTAVQDQQKAFNELVGRLGTFSAKAGALKDPANFNLFKSTSNNEEVAKVSGTEDATAGQYELEVARLATAQKVASKSVASVVNPLGVAGTIEISTSKAALKGDPTKKAVSINILATDSLKDIARKINGADGVGVSASMLALSNGENRLVLTAKDEGSMGFSIKETAGNALTAGLGLISDTQVARSSFSLLKQVGGPAELTDKIGALSTGIGANNLNDGDAIVIKTTGADGVARPDFTFSFAKASDDVGTLLTNIGKAFGNSNNSASGDKVNVTLDSNGEIVVTDTSNGTSPISFSLSLADDGNGSTLALGGSKSVNNFTNVVNAGSNAFFKLDGMAVTSQSNSAEGIVRGTTFELLKAEPGTVVKLGLSQDVDGIVKKVQEFVDEYNSLLKFIDEKTKVTVEPDKENKAQSGKTSTTVKKGPLANDGVVRKLRTELQGIIGGAIQELASQTQYTSLSRIGIVTGSSNDGQLEVKTDKLKAAITTDFEGIRRLFGATAYSDNPNFELGRYTKNTQTGTYFVDANADIIDQNKSASVNSGSSATRGGLTLTSKDGDSKDLSIKAQSGTGSGSFTFVRGVASQIDRWYQLSNDYVNGTFKTAREGYDRQIKNYEKRADDLDQRAERYRSQLVKQFSAMEQNMNRLKSQQASFQSQIRG